MRIVRKICPLAYLYLQRHAGQDDGSDECSQGVNNKTGGKAVWPNPLKSNLKMARPAGFEPATYGFVGLLLADGRVGKLLNKSIIPKS